MFSLIGVAYVVVGFAWNNKFTKIIFITCGLFLIAMNFIEKNTILTIIGIICMLTPMLIGRFYKEKKVEVNTQEI